MKAETQLILNFTIMRLICKFTKQMSTIRSTQQLQFEGYLRTPELWSDTSIFELEQLKFNLIQSHSMKQFPEMRLGMLVEQFVIEAISQDPSNEIIARNVQVVEDKITLGELDALLKLNSELIHLEIVYKFYLFDPKLSKNELECWIGPNRRDSLVEKLTKLKEKQCSLLYHPKTREILTDLGHSAEQFQQKVHFKAQLFIPHDSKNRKYEAVNNDCIEGVYFSREQLNGLKNHQFYIPTKLDWLTVPHHNVDWIDFSQFEMHVLELLDNKMSPMCWSKSDTKELNKFFVTVWE